MTGRAAGYCAGYDEPGFRSAGFGRGFRRGPGWGAGPGWGRGYGAGPWAGRGYGFRRGFYPGAYRGAWDAPVMGAPDRDAEAKYLKREAEGLEEYLEELRSRLSDLESGTESE